MRRPAVLAAVLCAAAVVAVLAVGALQRNSLAFTLGVNPAVGEVILFPGQNVCQTPIDVPAGGAFDRVVVQLGSFHRAGPAVAVAVRDTATRRVLARGLVPAGYPDVGVQPTHVVRVGHVAAGRRVDVCLTDRGDRKVAVYGNADAAARTSSAVYDGKPAGVDLALIFRRSPRSQLAVLGDAASRAALFKFGWTGAWTFWLLGLLVLLAVPALLVRAVRAAATG
jgi:hypothetical protein